MHIILNKQICEGGKSRQLSEVWQLIKSRVHTEQLIRGMACVQICLFNIIFFFFAKWRQNCHFELWHAFFVSGGFSMCNNDRTLKCFFS